MRKVVVATGEVSTVVGSASLQGSEDGIGSAARFYQPQFLALDGLGNLYVSDRNTLVRQVNLATGRATTFAGSRTQRGVRLGPLPGSLSEVQGVAAAAAGEVFLVAAGENSILVAR